MAASIAIIDNSDIPIAVLKAKLKTICLAKIIVSRIIEVINPFTIARHMIEKTGQSIPIN
jgi:hypothetical protein